MWIIAKERWLVIFFKTVSHDIDHNTYHWLRPPHIQKNINLDNHEVDIKEYNFTYELEGKQGSNSMSTNPKYFTVYIGHFGHR